MGATSSRRVHSTRIIIEGNGTACWTTSNIMCIYPCEHLGRLVFCTISTAILQSGLPLGWPLWVIGVPTLYQHKQRNMRRTYLNSMWIPESPTRGSKSVNIKVTFSILLRRTTQLAKELERANTPSIRYRTAPLRSSGWLMYSSTINNYINILAIVCLFVFLYPTTHQ